MVSRQTETGTQTLVLTREFDAPIEAVWKAWTEPDQVKQWWGPEGFTAGPIENDLRVGGKALYCMISPEGKKYWSTGEYKEIVPMKRIVVTDSFADEKGNVVPATHYDMSADFPLELLLTVTFEERGGKTLLTLQHEGFPAGEPISAQDGWSTTLDKLEKFLKS